MKSRLEIENEIAKKKALLQNTALISKLPDKGQRVVENIQKLEHQLAQLDNLPIETLLQEKLNISNSKPNNFSHKSSNFIPHIDELEDWNVIDKTTDNYRKTEQLVIHGTRGVQYLQSQKQPRHTIFLEDEQSIQLESNYKEIPNFYVADEQEEEEDHTE